MARRAEQRTCPRWCVANHAREDEPSGVRHRGPTVAVDVVLRHLETGPGAGELLIELHQSVRDDAAWVYIGDGTTQRLELSRESAVRLVAALGEYLVSPEAG